MLVIVYDSSLPSFLTVASSIKGTRSYVLTKSPTAIYSSAGTQMFKRSITERHEGNSLPV